MSKEKTLLEKASAFIERTCDDRCEFEEDEKENLLTEINEALAEFAKQGEIEQLKNADEL